MTIPQDKTPHLVTEETFTIGADKSGSAEGHTAGPWLPIETRPRDATILIVVEPRENNAVFYGKRKPAVYPAYSDEDGYLCDPSTFKTDIGLDGPYYRATHWMPLPEPPSPSQQGKTDTGLVES